MTNKKITPGTTQALTEPAPINGSIAVPPNHKEASPARTGV